MESIKREAFEEWLKAQDWFKINEGLNDKGKQHHYLTPAGKIVIVQYNLQDELYQIMPWPPPQVQTQVVKGMPMDFRGGGQFPGLPLR